MCTAYRVCMVKLTLKLKPNKAIDDIPVLELRGVTMWDHTVLPARLPPDTSECGPP